MLRDFIDFLWALWGEWKALLTGGSIIALLSLWQIITRKSITRNVDWLLVGLTLLLAAFLSWRKQWVQGESRFIDIQPAELIALFDNRTEVHANLHTKRYIGRRIKLSVRVRDVHTLFPMGMVHMTSADGTRLHAAVAWWRVNEFSLLAHEFALLLCGRIREIDAMGIGLSGIEVIGVERQENNSTTNY